MFRLPPVKSRISRTTNKMTDSKLRGLLRGQDPELVHRMETGACIVTIFDVKDSFSLTGLGKSPNAMATAWS